MRSAEAAAPVPGWLQGLVSAVRSVPGEGFSRLVPPQGSPTREAAVLVLFGDGVDGPEVLLLERAADMRTHAGQVAFPGGGLDPGETAERAALREAHEETGLDPAGVQVLAVLPRLWLAPSGYAVTPVLGWWAVQSPVGAADPAETAAVLRVPLADLVDPACRHRVTGGRGFVGPAFEVGSHYVWGFTAGLLDRLLAVSGLALPYDESDVRPLPAAIQAALPGGGR